MPKQKESKNASPEKQNVQVAPIQSNEEKMQDVVDQIFQLDKDIEVELKTLESKLDPVLSKGIEVKSKYQYMNITKDTVLLDIFTSLRKNLALKAEKIRKLNQQIKL